MNFYLRNDGDFVTFDGVCMGSYIELEFHNLSLTNKGSILFQVTILHSLVHNEQLVENMGLVVRSVPMFRFFLKRLKQDRLNKISTVVNKFFGLKLTTPRITYSKLPFYSR